MRLRTALQLLRSLLSRLGERVEQRERMTGVAAPLPRRLGSLQRARLQRRPGRAALHKYREERVQGGAPTRSRLGCSAKRAPRLRDVTLFVAVRAAARAQQSAANRVSRLQAGAPEAEVGCDG